jgi:hypothetical protein
MQTRQWLDQLRQDIYDPDRFSSHGCVLLLDGHVDDLFLSNLKQPAIPLYQVLLDQYSKSKKVDAFIWYQTTARGGELHYEFNRFPNAAMPAPPPPPAPSSRLLDDLLADIEDDRAAWQEQHEGRTSRVCIPQEAIRDITNLLEVKGKHAVIVFHDVLWSIDEDNVLLQLQDWSRLCQDNNHLVVFGLRSTDLRWVKHCFPKSRRGVQYLSVDGPTAEEIKAYLIYRQLKERRHFFAWHLLNEIATQLSLLATEPTKGLREIIRLSSSTLDQNGALLDRSWLDSLPKAGHTAEEVRLSDIVLRSEEHAFLQNTLIPALRDPNWQEKEATRLGLPKEKIKAPNRILLVGPPGTGKTTIAKVIATECKLPFFSSKASDFQSKYRGEPLEKVERQFTLWRQNAPCVVFWDEVETVAANRSHAQHDDNPITQILAELESTAGKDENIIIVCATNMPEKLDTAFKSRFRTFEIGYPDPAGYKKLVEQYFATHLFVPGLSVDKVVEMFRGRAPRDIRNCAEDCITQLISSQQESQITPKMIHNWLRAQPIDEQVRQRWQPQ